LAQQNGPEGQGRRSLYRAGYGSVRSRRSSAGSPRWLAWRPQGVARVVIVPLLPNLGHNKYLTIWGQPYRLVIG
jgi:hypothetical protein